MCDSHVPKRMLTLAAMLLSSIAVSCGVKAGPTPTAHEPSGMATEAPTAIPQPTVPSGTSPPAAPWWLIAAEDGIYAVGSDGSGLQKLSDQVVYASMMGPFFGGAPGGGYLAYTQKDPASNEDSLYLLSVPGGEMKIITSLSRAVGPMHQGDAFFEAVQYISSDAGVAWSPDGLDLAFVGFIDGSTIDLYVYSVLDGSLSRLTDGSTPALQPMWSPDGTLISYHGVPGLLSGNGPVVDSIWVARADGSEDRKLLAATEGSQVEAIGWMDRESIIVHSYDFGAYDLRTVNIETVAEETLWEGYYSDAAVDVESGTVLLGVDPFAAEKNPDGQRGLFLIPPGGGPGVRIVEDDPIDVVWDDEAGLFFAETEFGILAVSSAGDFIDLDVPPSASGFPLVAPGTRDLAWTGKELWLGSLTSGLDNPPHQVFSEPVDQAVWGPQGMNLLFISGDKLYVARSPEFTPVVVGEGLGADLTALVPLSALGPEETESRGQTAECPSPSGRTPAISSAWPGESVLEIFEPQILEYLNDVGSADGLQAALNDLTLLDGAWRARAQVETVDVTGDSTQDVVVELTFFEEGQYSEGGLFVFMCQGGRFVSNILGGFAGQVLSSRDPDGIRAIQDMNQDGIPEIVHSQISIAGSHAYFTRDFRVFEWDGQEFADLVKAGTQGRVAQADTGDGVVRDVDGDGNLELVLTNAVGEAYPDLGPQRARTDIWAWDGRVFALARWEYTEPEFRIQAVWDGDDASVFGDFDAALAFYQQAVFDEKLLGWSKGRLWPDSAYGSSPIPTPDPAERSRLNAYGRYRIMLLHAVRGYNTEAQIVYDTLQERFPPGAVGHPYAELATVFWDEYDRSGQVGLACEKAAEYAADHADEILTNLGRSFYGIGQREYLAVDICPFE